MLKKFIKKEKNNIKSLWYDKDMNVKENFILLILQQLNGTNDKQKSWGSTLFFIFQLFSPYFPSCFFKEVFVKK